MSVATEVKEVGGKLSHTAEELSTCWNRVELVLKAACASAEEEANESL